MTGWLFAVLVLERAGVAQGQSNLATLLHSSSPVSTAVCALGPDQEQYWAWSGVSGSGGVAFRRSVDNGETFDPIVSWNLGYYPSVAAEAAVVCVVYQSRTSGIPAVVARVSMDAGASFLPEVDLSAAHGGGNNVSLIRSAVVAGVLKAAWVRGSSVYYCEVDLGVSPLSGVTTLVGSTVGGVQSLRMDASNLDVILSWHDASSRHAGFLAQGQPWVTTQLGSGGGGSGVAVACSQGVGIALWTQAHPTFPVANIVYCSRWNGSVWTPSFAVVGGSAPSQPYLFDRLQAAAVGINFYLLCSRNENSGSAPTMERAYVAKSYNQGVTWTSSVLDTDVLVGAHTVTNTFIGTSGASANGDVAVLWDRTHSGSITTRFAKSLDGGATWLGACGGDPACQEPVYIHSALGGAGARGLYVSDSSVVAAVASSGGGGGSLPAGFYSMLVAGFRRYEVCDVASPLVCGGSPGTSIAGFGIPWVDEVPTVPSRTYNVTIAAAAPAAYMVYGIAEARLSGLQAMTAGFLPHIDLTNPILINVGSGQSASAPVPMLGVASANLYGARLYFQGAFLDASAGVVEWTDGLEVRMN